VHNFFEFSSVTGYDGRKPSQPATKAKIMSNRKSDSRLRTGNAWFVMIGTAVLWSAGWLPHPVSAAVKTKHSTVAERLVRQALRQEIDGSHSERTKLLESALEKSPGCRPARWHSGQVRYANQWASVDDVPQLSARNKRVAAYHRLRDTFPQTIEGQLELANWCSKRKLDEQARAHLTKVLELDPNHAEARRRLGFRLVNGVWLSRQEVLKADVRARQTLEALRDWKPILEKILVDLAEGKEYRRQSARKRLEAIDDPAVIPVMELVFSAHGERGADLLVAQLDKMTAHEASVSLARQAVFSPWEAVRDTAVEKLKSRPKETFVPVLLSAMYTPVQSRAELYQGPDGRLMYRHVLFREGQKHKELAVFDTTYRNTALPGGFRQTVTAANQTAEQRENEVARQNEFTEVLNNRICSVLAAVTSHDLPASPENWWKWWNDYNEVYVSDEKPLRQRYRREEAGPLQGKAPGANIEALVSTGIEKMSDCLAAGTVVWTELGAVPIEQVKLGDRVLSQDPETGELAYKPVLATTIRPAGPLVKIDLGGESFETSGGHPFWISGEGWVKSRNLKNGSPLHRVSGTLDVGSVGDGGNRTTYNLIVADFHTYFVGQAKILSHDNTIREPTNAVVPGLTNR